MVQRLGHRDFAIWLFAVVVAVGGLVTAGCAGPQVPPESPEAKEPAETQQAWNPFAAVEPGGRIFISYLGGEGGSKYHLFFTRSLDGGVTWLPEPVLLDTPPSPNSRIGFHRLETDGAGRVSVTWSIERQEMGFWRAKEVRHRRSLDAGKSWTGETLKLSFDEKSNYPTPQAGQDGELDLLWIEGAGQRAVPRFTRTTGGGMAWAPKPLTLSSAEGTADEQQGDSRVGEGAWPFLAIGPERALYAVWQEIFKEGADILFNRSQDGGATWMERSVRLNSRPSRGGGAARIPVAATDETGGVYVVWEDSRHSTTDIYFNRSLDGGATWLDEDVWLTAVRPPVAAATGPILHSDRSGRLYLLWTDIREAPYSLYFNRSLDRGATWLLQPIRLDHHGPKEITFAPRLANDDAGHVYAAWWEGPEATKGSVRFSRSDDSGATWLNKEQVLDTGHGENGPRFPWLSADGQGGVYIVWSSDRSGRYQLFLNRSTDHGKTWLSQDIKITGSSPKVARER
jgi:hypothetical protein